MVKIIDTHAHYDDKRFDKDRESLFEEMKNDGVSAIVNIGCNLSTSQITVDMTKKYDFIYGVVGFHPGELDGAKDQDLIEIKKMCKEDKILAVGEIGLDYHYDGTDKALQHKWFMEQLQLASEENLPIVIHSRDAAADTFDILKNYDAKNGGVVHCYSYSKEMAKEYVKLGYYVGVGGVVTYGNARKLKEVVEDLPLSDLVLETDCPYLAPQQHRGKRNYSSYLTYVAEEIARIKNISVEEVYNVTFENAKKLYKTDFGIKG